jgi:uncharacterized membrane protein YfcA
VYDYRAYKSSTIRYWERRRIFYNLALVLPAFISYMAGAALAHAGDPHKTYFSYVLGLFVLYALGANVCYSFAYVLEFFLWSEDARSRWLRFGRTSVFVIGILLGMFLAVLGGANIAQMEFYYGVHP